ncbi:LysM peptidoglycan-binding domain-containing protein [Desulfosporosinus hippei]|uniref:LysM domain-containing protein n=1 Tax=Desulfosporosinus hippei DSM 8344 TaxID=1121419 RepID=A0A1G8J729_9FIRM|nr:LysM domain-containing protein [Desulfosporosinus hippei]SDI26450.1 LysM domain-containing protein [Desulfosporosinus hippei DSM 8344]
MTDNKYDNSMIVSATREEVPCPGSCQGMRYTVQAGDTLYFIARRFNVTVQQIRDANPQIVNPNLIFLGQVICIPTIPQPDSQLKVLTLRFLTETGQQLPIVDGAVQLTNRVIVRATFNRPVSRAFFFLEPTGTDTCEFARLIGIDCPSTVTGVAEIFWQVPPGTLGRVYVIACINSICTKSDDVLVILND